MMLWMNWEEMQGELRAKIKGQRGAAAEIARRKDVSRAAVSEYVNDVSSNIPPSHLSVILEVLRLELIAVPKGTDPHAVTPAIDSTRRSV